MVVNYSEQAAGQLRKGGLFLYFTLRDKMDALGSLEEPAVRI